MTVAMTVAKPRSNSGAHRDLRASLPAWISSKSSPWLNIPMASPRRNMSYAGAALAAVASIAGLLSWWVPSSAGWLNRHGFIAWPVAVFFMLLFGWAVLNWHHSKAELAKIQDEMSSPIPEDRRLFQMFREAIPKDSPSLIWLRNCASDRSYRPRDIAALREFVRGWLDSDRHFMTTGLERIVQRLCETTLDFCTFQAQHSSSDPRSTDDDPHFRAYGFTYDAKQDAIVRGLDERADRILYAHNELYTAGILMGL